MKHIISFLFCILSIQVFGQNLNSNIEIFQERIRREQLGGIVSTKNSFLLRPISLDKNVGDSAKYSTLSDDLYLKFQKGRNVNFILNPIVIGNKISGNPYPEASNYVISKGFQSFSSLGFQGSLGPLSIQINPEFIYAQNIDYDIGIFKSTGTEYLEKFGDQSFYNMLPGQSNIKLNFGAFSVGASTENIWWGPGQFNSLLFSNNAFGFEHLTLNTRRPAETFLGTFEGQILIGKLEGTNFESPISNRLREDWRYLNGITFSYQPKWIPGFYIGASRVFQQYNSSKGNRFEDYFPIFGGLQKERLLEDFEDPGEFDRAGRDQQLTGFVRYINKKAKAELYFEFGRRDHSFNWREAVINPEHARAYLIGFNKLFSLPNDAAFQLRTEVLQQQESINIIIRYPGIGGGQNWSGHVPIRHGFTHRGQMLGPGVGPSSNIQTIEGAWVKGFKKLGLRFERLNRHQDIYTKRFNDPSEQGRWVDLSARILADWQFDNLIISSNINFVNSLNYQWQLAPDSTPEYPKGENLFSVHSQVSLIYLFQKKKDLK